MLAYIPSLPGRCGPALHAFQDSTGSGPEAALAPPARPGPSRSSRRRPAMRAARGSTRVPARRSASPASRALSRMWSGPAHASRATPACTHRQAARVPAPPAWRAHTRRRRGQANAGRARQAHSPPPDPQGACCAALELSARRRARRDACAARQALCPMSARERVGA